ncbi:hypothetical protein [Pseudovibrio sp. Tun.PSC04-5.I4]|uniref:hypothetical protein n=1 Tax=Pseudovibrio sp. Tun.PSC04-5.I4 TaxID=1798213 RepID=UPI0013565D85|nr:hypothetical protein [Pseudovibrio sp. Tun.PSC04-5.I4]
MSVISSSFSSVYSFSKTMNKSPKEATSTQAEKTKPAPEVASPTKKQLIFQSQKRFQK